MVNAIHRKYDGEAFFTITLNSLANNACRCSTKVTNSNNRKGAIITIGVTSGTSAPTSGQVCEVYILRDTGTSATDNWAGSDAAFTPINAKGIGAIENDGSTSKLFVLEFVVEPLSPAFGIAVFNKFGTALATTGNGAAYITYYDEIQ
jgi:hypothetical protein